MNNSLFIEQDTSDKGYIAFSEFTVLAVNWATTVTKNEIVSFCFFNQPTNQPINQSINQSIYIFLKKAEMCKTYLIIKVIHIVLGL